MRIVVFFLLVFSFNISMAAAASCPVSESEKSFLEDAVGKFVNDAIYTADSSGVNPNGFLAKAHFAYASTLLGKIRFRGINADPGILEGASLTELCKRPKTFERTCRSQSPEPPEDRFWKHHDVCVQISCEANGLYLAEIKWSTLPETKSEPFAYVASNKNEIVYEPSPSVTWRMNDRIPRRLIITGELHSSANVKSDKGENIRATYTGNLTAITTEEQGLSSLVLQMSFPALRAPLPVRAELLLHHHDDSSANGTIAIGNDAVAALTLSPGEPLKINWISPCQ